VRNRQKERHEDLYKATVWYCVVSCGFTEITTSALPIVGPAPRVAETSFSRDSGLDSCRRSREPE
jgi:hypothetical protein